MPAGPGQPNDQLFERWRVGDHWRVNPLMYSAFSFQRRLLFDLERGRRSKLKYELLRMDLDLRTRLFLRQWYGRATCQNGLRPTLKPEAHAIVATW
jgi:hypothetical protein